MSATRNCREILTRKWIMRMMKLIMIINNNNVKMSKQDDTDTHRTALSTLTELSCPNE